MREDQGNGETGDEPREAKGTAWEQTRGEQVEVESEGSGEDHLIDETDGCKHRLTRPSICYCA